MIEKRKYQVIKHNAYYVGLIQNLYSGSESETTSMLQLLYQSYVLSPFENDFRDFFYNMALDEIDHQGMLAELIIMLGGDPIFCNAQGKWFGGRNIDYIKDLRQMILIDIEYKEKLIIDYKTTIAKIESIEIKNTLEIILADEIKHKDLLKNKYNSIFNEN